MCKLCSKLVDEEKLKRANREHVCSDKYCNVCNSLVDAQHQCCIQKYTKKTPRKFSLICFDIECCQNERSTRSETGYTHTPNLIIASQMCHSCFENAENEPNCVNCVVRTHYFELETCVEKFIDFVEEHRAYAHDNITVVAHNFKYVLHLHYRASLFYISFVFFQSI